MMWTAIASLPFVAVAVCVVLAWLILARARREPVHWAFAAALAALAVTEVGNGIDLWSATAEEALRGRRIALVGELLMPLGWLIFSLSFAKSAVASLLREWRSGLWGTGLLTAVFLSIAWSNRFFFVVGGESSADATIALGPTGILFGAVYITAQVLILANLEQALRQADEQHRWYLKFPALGLALLCAFFLYQTTDLLLYGRWRPELGWLSGAVAAVACGIMGYGLLRRPIPDVPIYVSPKVVTSSLTFLIVGGALFGTGAVASLLRYSGVPGGTALSVLFIFVAVTALAFMVLSEHLRQIMGRFVERHFFPHKYDYRARWMEVTAALGAPGTAEQIAWRAVQLLKGIVGARTIALWLAGDGDEGMWIRAGSYHVTSPNRIKSAAIGPWLAAQHGPVSVDESSVPQPLREAAVEGGAAILLPLQTGPRAVGWLALGPPAAAGGYGQQDIDLMACIAAQVADRLQHLVLSERLLLAREMEAFYEYSTFVLHDLKNFTATLSLVLQNAERHGGDPSFQQAAMRSIGATVRKMTQLIGTVSALSREPSPRLAPVDLNALTAEVLKTFSAVAGTTLVRDEGPVPPVEADAEQLYQVLLNLILNAQEAVGPAGEIRVQTRTDGAYAVVVVEDNGCGMDAATIAGLFRPFRSRKGRGLGIGLYQCRKIVQAHGGDFDVESEIGRGSRFAIRLRGLEPFRPMSRAARLSA
ncbi:MAG TPA: XrtA/PEP-CTERM system histidine kinase PrsK [Nitrospirales bacterium]|nr:XrtA/PEP-CTERM system histidine kinase PrsK [Nitrospirales bacterium]